MRTAAEFLRNPNLFTTSVLALLIDKFGMEFMDWDPVTVGLEIESTYGIEPTTELQDRIQAGSSLYTSNLFFVSLEAFSTVCNTLNFGATTSEILVPADLDDVMWGCTEAMLLLGDMYDNAQFSHNVRRYVGALLNKDGFIKPPRLLEFAEFEEGRELRTEEAFQDDDTFRQSFWAEQEHEKAMLEDWNKAKLAALMEQLKGLPLKNGSPEFISEAMSRLSTKGGEQYPAPVPTDEASAS